MVMEKFCRKIIIYSFLFIFSFLNSIKIYSIDLLNSKIILLNFKGGKVNIYNSPIRDSIITVIHDNKNKEKYYEFDVVEKEDSMIKVIAKNTLDSKTIKGWIRISDTGIYTRTYLDNMYPLYENPNYKSKVVVKIFDKSGTLVQVLDIRNKWLKIRIKYKNRFIEYWLPFEYQCPTVYNSCS